MAGLLLLLWYLSLANALPFRPIIILHKDGQRLEWPFLKGNAGKLFLFEGQQLKQILKLAGQTVQQGLLLLRLRFQAMVITKWR